MLTGKFRLDHDLSSLSILLVDDNSSMRKVLRNLLSTLKTGPILEADSALDALRVLQEIPIDLVVTDLKMEPVSGLDLVRMLRTGTDSPNPRVPIIMLTGHTDIHLVEEARDVGIDEFIAKPVSMQSLYDRIVEICENLRPFVNSDAYTGPDRRRRDNDFAGDNRRRKEAELEPRDSKPSR